MPRNVVQSFLQDSVHVDAGSAVHKKRLPLLLIGYGNSGLPFHSRDVPIECALEPRFVEHDRMQGLRQGPHFLETRLDNFAHFMEVGAQGGAFRSMRSSPAQHGPNCREDLAKFVVQLTRDVTEGGFLGGDQLLREFTAALGNFGETSEQAAVPADQRKTIQKNRQERCGEKEVDLPLYAIINLDDPLASLFFVLSILDKETGHGCTQRGLPFLQGELNLSAGFRFLTLLRESENAVDGVPKLGDRAGQESALLQCAAGSSKSSLQSHSIVEIGSNSLELGRPGCQRVRFVAADHVAHGNGEQIQIVLNTQELKRVFSVAIN